MPFCNNLAHLLREYKAFVVKWSFTRCIVRQGGKIKEEPTKGM